MSEGKVSTFEIVLLVVGIITAILGFKLINQAYTEAGNISWLMLTSVFNWLILLVLFVSLSLTVDISKKQLTEMRNIADSISRKKSRK